MMKRKQPHVVRPVSGVRVVIIAGTFVSAAAARVYEPLADVFRRRDYAVKILTIPRLGLGSLDDAANRLDEAIFSEDDAQLILVGHSQGGVHTLDLAGRHPDRVVAVFNFATPHHGTRLASLGHWVSWVPAIRGMEAHSRHLHNLRGVREFEEENIHSLYTIFDQLVVPWFASTMYGAKNVVLAPAILHRLLSRAGFRRSEGVELIHGYAEHLFVIWHRQFHDYIGQQLDRLAGQQLELVG